MNGRPHCTCEEIVNLPVAKVAEILGFRERKVREHLKFVPHQKAGDQRVLCPCELRLLQMHFTVVPAAPATEAEHVRETAAVRDLRSLTPSRGRRSRRTA